VLVVHGAAEVQVGLSEPQVLEDSVVQAAAPAAKRRAAENFIFEFGGGIEGVC